MKTQYKILMNEDVYLGEPSYYPEERHEKQFGSSSLQFEENKDEQDEERLLDYEISHFCSG